MTRASQHTICLFPFAFCLVAAVALGGCLRSDHTVTTSLLTPHSSLPQLDRSYGQLPLSFEANQGQTDSPVRFLSRGRGYTLFLTQDEAVFVLRKAKAETEDSSRVTRHASREYEQTVLRMRLEGANLSPIAHGLSPLPGIVNYFIGSDPKKWHTNIPTYKKVEYNEIYPGIDLAYYGNQGKLEYDLIVAPGADPTQIKLAFDGAKEITLADSGDLILTTDIGDVRLQKPVVYQLDDKGHRTLVAGSYVLPSGVEGRVASSEQPSSESELPATSYQLSAIGIQLASYDKGRPLIIDPVLAYSTYFGRGDVGVRSFVVDASGNAYLAGFTYSADFPTTPGAFQTAFGGSYDTIVAKLGPAGAAVYSTYLGGSNTDEAEGIAVDTTGNAYVTGLTGSTDFPTTPGAFQTTYGGGSRDAFVTKLNPSGSALVYSTYLGGSDFDSAQFIALDTTGNAYLASATHSTDFPTTPGAFQTTLSGPQDAFVTKLNPTGTALVYSTYLGGSGGDGPAGFAVDPAGNAYVLGNTTSTDFPTTPGAFQTTFGGGNDDAFVTKLNPTGSALVYSTLLGGSGVDAFFSFDVDAAGNAYLAGFTLSTDFPTTPGAFQTTPSGPPDAFVTKLNPTGTALVYSTYLGGSGEEVGRNIAVDASGNAYVVGNTGSADFPTTPGAFQTTFAGSVDAFVAKLNSAGSLVYSTYLGGSAGDSGHDIVVDASGNAYVTGSAASTDFPTVNPLQLTFGGNQDAFVAKLDASGSALVYSTLLGGSGSDTIIGIAVDDAGNAYVTGVTVSTDFPTVNPFQPLSGAPEEIEVGFAAKVLPSLPSFNTAAGSTVTVPLGSGVSVSFPTVSEQGNTTMTTSTTGPTPPAGFSLGTPPTYYDITTNATFAAPVKVCIKYDPSQFVDPSMLHLLHFEGNAWVDVTISNDTDRGIICGEVSSFSLFVIAEPGAVLAVNIDIKPGTFPNTINLGSQGTVPVAIFSTPSFDATTVNPLTVTLASAPVHLKGKGTPMASFQDVNGDSLLDLVVHVETEALELSPTDTIALLEGTTFTAVAIRGADSVRVVP